MMKRAKVYLNSLVAGILPEDDEELALTLNGKKKKIKREYFEKAMLDSGMDEKAVTNLFNKFTKALPKWAELIRWFFLPKDKQVQIQEFINRMAMRLRLVNI